MTTIIKCCIDKKYIKIPLKILNSQTKITLIEAIKKVRYNLHEKR